MVRILMIAAVLVTAPWGTAAASEKPDPQQIPAGKKADPSGVYLCEGTNPDGHKYRGIVQIAAVQNTFLVKWTLADDIEVMGVGILQEDRLSVSYFGGTPAVVVYKIGAEKLVGEWTMGGTEGRVYAETLTTRKRSRACRKERRRRSRGRNSAVVRPLRTSPRPAAFPFDRCRAPLKGCPTY
jgi:hypothetical protein